MIIVHEEIEWEAELTNPQIEPSYKAYTLVLSSSLGTFRIEKCFKPTTDISHNLLEQEARREISIIQMEIIKENN